MDFPHLLVNSFNKYLLCVTYRLGTLLGDRIHSCEHSLCSEGIYNLVGRYR